ncbi:MAG: maleylpyruvate isomerase family mycothiol-dependent enzyme [Actinomycetota bacterium]|nr:maleylpyruvate isomerase family mycothiol-dependent enzyme [Actinomycetota bacterium]
MLVSPRYDGPPIISITGRPDDQLAPVRRQRKRLEAMLTQLSDDDWTSASRCDDWTVQDVVAHIVGVNVFWHASVRAGLAGTPTRVLAGFDPATTPAVMVAAMRELAPTETLAQFVTSNDEFLGVLAELDDAGWATLAESPAGHVPIRLVAHHALWDCWIHERDIALPLGLTPPAEPDEVASSLRYAAAVSPALAIGTGHLLAGRFAVEATDPSLCCLLDVGESVAVQDEIAPPDVPCLRGDAVTLVEALSIRVPMPPSAPPEWLGLLEGLATAFTAEARAG